MKAITLWPEWAWAICVLDKRVENRGWRPGATLGFGAKAAKQPLLAVGERIAIHAGKSFDGRAAKDAIEDAALSVAVMYWRERYDAPAWTQEEILDALRSAPRSAIVATAAVTGCDRDLRTSWDVPEAWHWRLSDVRVLAEPVPCRGAQGLWDVPADLLPRVTP